MSKSIAKREVVTIRQAIESFLLSCKVEGKSYGTIECYTDKLKGFLWYATNYHWLDDVTAITTDNLRQFLAYLRQWWKFNDPNKHQERKFWVLTIDNGTG